MNTMHVQKMDVLQSQIFGLILKLWTLHSNAWRKRHITATEQMKLELELEHKHYEYHEH
jgi:hypothetical protein